MTQFPWGSLKVCRLISRLLAHSPLYIFVEAAASVQDNCRAERVCNKWPFCGLTSRFGVGTVLKMRDLRREDKKIAVARYNFDRTEMC